MRRHSGYHICLHFLFSHVFIRLIILCGFIYLPLPHSFTFESWQPNVYLFDTYNIPKWLNFESWYLLAEYPQVVPDSHITDRISQATTRCWQKTSHPTPLLGEWRVTLSLSSVLPVADCYWWGEDKLVQTS